MYYVKSVESFQSVFTTIVAILLPNRYNLGNKVYLLGGIDLRIEQLEYLIAISRCRSMNRAGEEIHISQQAISLGISQLEEEFDTKLVIRTKKGSLLTTEGAQLVRLAETFFLGCDQLRHKTCSHQSAQLVILLAPYDDDYIWNQVLLFFYEHYPKIELTRHTLQSLDLKTELEKQPEAVALTYVADMELARWASAITYQILRPYSLYVITASDSILSGHKTISINSIKNHKILLHHSKDEKSVISQLFLNYPYFIANNEFLFHGTMGLFFQLIAHDKKVIGFIPVADTQIQLLQQQAPFYSPGIDFEFVKIKENITINFCCATAAKTLPTELLHSLEQVTY